MKRIERAALFLILLVVWSCGDDDDASSDEESVAVQTVAETVITNEADIMTFLQTHFYNYAEFANPPVDFDFKIRIEEITGDTPDELPLIDFVQTSTFLVPEIDDEDDEVLHTLYTIVAREGSTGNSPTIGDDVFVRFEGSLLDGTLFDASTAPTPFNLSQVVRGFGNGVAQLSVGEGPIDNGDGTISFEDSGIGLFIMPAGLGFFTGTTNIPSFSPLVFTAELLTFTENTDTDGDNLPSILEDIDGDGNLNNDDTDEDGLPNYVDTDDDGDGTLTINEDLEPDQDTAVDRDGDGDATNDVGDGNPLNDDTDGDGIPNYLDTDDSASREFEST